MIFLPAIGFAGWLLVGLVTGPTIDQGINCATGGDCSHTISGEAGVNRRAGSKSAAAWCELYNGTVSWVDGVRWTPESHRAFALLEKETGRASDHCEKWAAYELGELEAAKHRLPPAVVPAAPRGAKHGLRVVR